MSLNLSHIGSYQRGGVLVETERPVDEAWRRIARLGTHDYIGELSPDKPDINWERHKQYSIVRIHQSIEFRASAGAGSLLSRPLPLYYSFLNLIRATLSIVPEIIPKPQHGLKQKTGSSLWECAAEIHPGTFTDLLDWLGVPWKKGTTLSLKQCLSRTPEVSRSFASPKRGKPNVCPVTVRSRTSGEVKFLLDPDLIEVETFQANWMHWYPKLAQRFKLSEGGSDLYLSDAILPKSYEEVCSICEELLVPRLTLGSSAIWFLEREDNAPILMPRLAQYLAAMFILGSLVRYEPELLDEAGRAASEDGWFLDEFLSAAERFFPQLILERIYQRPFYFGGTH